MDNSPLVSICIPVYGTEKYITKCFMSLIDQDYKNIELVFVNDCTKDNSILILNDLIKKYNFQSRTKIVNHIVNQGLASARISGIKESTGDFLFFLDSDDTIPSNAISSLLSIALKKGADIVEGNFTYIDNKGRQYSVKKHTCEKKEYLKKLLALQTPVSVCAKLYKRTLFSKNGTFFKLAIDDGEDFATTPRIVDMASTVAFSDQFVYNYFISNPNSYTNSKGLKTIQDMVSAFSILTAYFSTKNDAGLQNAIDLGKSHFIRTNYYCMDPKLRYSLNDYFPEIKGRIDGESLMNYYERRLMSVKSGLVYFGLKNLRKIRSILSHII